MIFYFEAFDEQWKGIDDGWGLWDIDRDARYVLCGTPVGRPASPTSTPAPAITTRRLLHRDLRLALHQLRAWWASGAAPRTPGRGGSGRRHQQGGAVLRSATAESFAGTVVGTAGGLTVGAIPFDASNTRMAGGVLAARASACGSSRRLDERPRESVETRRSPREPAPGRP